ncbi:Nucleic acid-binding, OB-fold [Sesbania bispinosa]|nr:Nucleic acid-binding, OB-fold [Sesbania bispinosa]
MAVVTNLFIPVKDISPLQGPWWTTVQVIRMWHKTFCSEPTRILSVEIVFMDKQGTKIQGSISRDILRMRRVEMDEGNYYDLKGVFVVPNDGEDRPTSHPYRLVFDISSQIVLVEQRSLTCFGLSPLTTVDIQRRKTQTQDLVDKVGILTSISCERRYVRKDKQVNAVFLEITDPTYVYGDVAIEAVVSVTRVAFNPTIPEVFDMKNWLVMNGVRLEGRLKFKKMDEPQSSIRDEFLLYHKKRQIGQLLRGGQVEVSDGKDITYLLLGDEDVYKLLQVPCEELLTKIQDLDGPMYPPIFERLIGESMLFLVECKQVSYNFNEDCFKVIRVCVERELIRMFLRGEMFSHEGGTSSTIARLVGAPGDEAYYHHGDCSSYASAMPDENFHTADSNVGQMSSSSSVSYKNCLPRQTGVLDEDPEID